MFLISTLFDPRHAFFFYSPLIFSLNTKIGNKIMWASVLTEWSNQILKWLLHGERPYWWIHETQVYNGTEKIPEVQQFFITCETGPGSPSGHAMVTASIWYILVASFLKRKNLSDNKSNIFKRIIWSVYTLLICSVSLSRVYIAAHFPHQCLLGALIGITVAVLTNHFDTSKFKRSHYIKGSIGVLGSAMLTYAFLRLLGMNPMWSVDRALKWCSKREYVHLDTTPFFSIARYTGFFFGMGIGLTSDYHNEVFKTKLSTSMKIFMAIFSLGLAKLIENIPLPKFNRYLFYLTGLAMNAIFAYTFTALIPYLIFKINNSKFKLN